MRRAEYLLGLLGGPTGQQEKSLDQAFLMEMMEFRERIEGAKAGDPAGLDAIEAELTARNAGQIEVIAGLFRKAEDLPEGDPQRAGLLVQARRTLNAVKTVRSLLRDLRLD